jgi:hypothetical protein
MADPVPERKCMDREQTVRELATKHFGVETLEERKSDRLDFHSVPVWSMRAALGAAYDAGRAAASPPADEGPVERSGEWVTMTVDDAVEHLKTWIDGLDDPSEIATLMIHVCGCPRAAVIGGTHIAAEMP